MECRMLIQNTQHSRSQNYEKEHYYNNISNLKLQTGMLKPVNQCPDIHCFQMQESEQIPQTGIKAQS